MLVEVVVIGAGDRRPRRTMETLCRQFRKGPVPAILRTDLRPEPHGANPPTSPRREGRGSAPARPRGSGDGKMGIDCRLEGSVSYAPGALRTKWLDDVWRDRRHPTGGDRRQSGVFQRSTSGAQGFSAALSRRRGQSAPVVGTADIRGSRRPGGSGESQRPAPGAPPHGHGLRAGGVEADDAEPARSDGQPVGDGVGGVGLRFPPGNDGPPARPGRNRPGGVGGAPRAGRVHRRGARCR